MILDLDCGNRSLKWRLSGAGGRLRGGACEVPGGDDPGAVLRRVEEECATCDGAVRRVRLVSVAPQAVGRSLCANASRLWGVEVECARVAAAADGVSNAYDEPARLGADRWLAILAARRRSGEHPLVIVDCGTMLTVDFVSSSGRHLGGYIGPGYYLLLQAACSGAVGIDIPLESPPPPAPGRSTSAAVRGGAVLMLAGLVSAALRRGRELDSNREDPVVFLTGGDAEWLRDYLPPETQWVPDLVLDGLECVLP